MQGFMCQPQNSQRARRWAMRGLRGSGLGGWRKSASDRTVSPARGDALLKRAGAEADQYGPSAASSGRPRMRVVSAVLLPRIERSQPPSTPHQYRG